MTQLEQLSDEFIDLITHLFKRGTSAFLIIFGRRETGKTDFGLLIAEILYNEGLIQNVATNIKIYNSPFEIKHITNLDDLKLWCRETHGKKLFIFDEFGKAFRRRTPMASLNVKLIDEFQILRKYKLSTVAVTVDEKYIDQTALGSDVLDGIFIKTDYKNPKVALYLDNLEYFRKRITGIPRTSIDFDTWDVAPFKEHGPKAKPAFKDRDLEICWEWSHGKTIKDLGLHNQQLNRIVRKFVKEVMEREGHVSPSLERAVEE
ncbi:MAG: hypothetical protein QHH12_08130 [Candidatus Bathyarchaeota archaeon]|jgi:hypothetical protein|nr:hypothetical protein [Candidatus Bathyarchaeota archaeon]